MPSKRGGAGARARAVPPSLIRWVYDLAQDVPGAISLAVGEARERMERAWERITGERRQALDDRVVRLERAWVMRLGRTQEAASEFERVDKEQRQWVAERRRAIDEDVRREQSGGRGANANGRSGR